MRLQSEEGIEFRLLYSGDHKVPPFAKSVLLVVLDEKEAGTTPQWVKKRETKDQAIVYCEPRGIGATKWTTKNPPNFVARSHVLLGRTVDAGRVWDVIAAAKYLAGESSNDDKKAIHIAGSGAAGLIAAYAAAMNPDVESVTLIAPPTSHMDTAAPQFLNVLRVCDVPDSLGLLAPRRLTIIGSDAKAFERTAAAYAAADAKDRLKIEQQ